MRTTEKKDDNLYVRINGQTKAAAEMLFESLGLTLSDAVNIFIKKSLSVGGLPFELKTESASKPVSGGIDFSPLRAFLDEEGRIIQYPAKRKAKVLCFFYLIQKFEAGRVYTEPEVNELLTRWHTFGDYCTFRRELCDCGFLVRENKGGSYQMAEVQPKLEDIFP